ncbi:beta-carotene 15,15'-monooxygenase [Corynebacterium incognita]|uniref:beta-carotene 15,15'-monooxygenase n=1 Tax=Corynebacterium incognita TaxID=2754725 RepID=UPI001FE58C73|nr:beta-carotene 15,15'-monooxygenase [Corynebacterium incognita]
MHKPSPQTSSLQVSDVSLRDRGRWHSLVAAVACGWMLVTAGLIIAARAGAAVVWWDIIHSLTLGAVTTAIFAYSTHFTEALTRTKAAPYRWVATRIALVHGGLVLLLADRAGFDWGALADAGAVLVIVAALWQAVVVGRALRGSLSGSFAVTVPFYIAAVCFLIAAIVLAIVAGHGVGEYSALIAAHSRATVWGFAWLTVVGTVVTLLPTLSGTAISPVARARCSRALMVHCLGLAIAIAALVTESAALAGLGLAFVGLAAVLVAQPVIAGVFTPGARRSTAAVSVVAGLVWLIALCWGDAAMLAAGVFPRRVTLEFAPALLGGGLAQLITGVLLHLLPTLRGGGPEKVWAGRQTADCGGPARLLLINAGALLTLLPTEQLGVGFILIVMGLFGHVVALAAAVYKQKRLDTP